MAKLQGWSYGKTMKVPASVIDADLPYFPCPVYLNSSNFDFSKCKADGSDIRFTDKNLNFLKHERVEHNLTRLNISTSNTGADLCMFYKSNLITAGNVTILTVDAKVIETGTAGHEFAINNGARSAILNLSATGIICNRAGTSPYTYAMDTKVRHTYMLKLQGTSNCEFYVDGVLVHSATYANLYRVAVNSLGFGDGTTASNYGGKIEYYSASYNLDYSGASSNFVTWLPTSGLPTDNGWLCDGTVALSSIISAFAKYNVLLPTVSDLTDTEFYMWYGNPSAYNTSVEAWQDMTGKQLQYFGNVKLMAIPDAMRIATSTTGTDNMMYYKNGIVTTANTKVVEALVKVENSGSLGNQSLAIADGTRMAVAVINSNSIVCNFGGTSPYTHSVDMTSGFNAVIIELQSTTQAVFKLNGTAIHTAAYSNLQSSTANQLMFGDGSGVANYGGSILWKSVKYNLSYNTTPTAFAEWNANSLNLPTANGWTAYGTTSLATLITANYTGRWASHDGSGDYFSILNNTAHNINGKFYTIEYKVKFNTVNATQVIIEKFTAPSGPGWTSYLSAGSVKKLAFYNGTELASNSVIVENRIYDVAYCINTIAGTADLYIDGVLDVSGNIGTNAISNNPMLIGIRADGTIGLNGNLLGVRLTKGRKRYTSSYTPPTKFEIDGSDVVFCTNFDTIYSQDYAMVQHMGDSLVDATGNGNNGTATGTTVVSTEYGKARDFNGSTDCITLPMPALIDKYTDIIMFKTDLINQSAWKQITGGSTSTNNYSLFVAIGADSAPTDNKVRTNVISSGNSIPSTTSVNTTDKFVITTSYNGATPQTKLYMNGLQEANTNANSGAVPLPPGIIMGKYYGATTRSLDGQIFERRMLFVDRPDAYIKAESKALKNELLIVTDYVDTLALFGLMF